MAWAENAFPPLFRLSARNWVTVNAVGSSRVARSSRPAPAAAIQRPLKELCLSKLSEVMSPVVKVSKKAGLKTKPGLISRAQIHSAQPKAYAPK